MMCVYFSHFQHLSLALLAAASQRVEFVILDWFGNDWMHEILREWERKERGAFPGVVETAIIIYIQGIPNLPYNIQHGKSALFAKLTPFVSFFKKGKKSGCCCVFILVSFSSSSPPTPFPLCFPSSSYLLLLVFFVFTYIHAYLLVWRWEQVGSGLK